MARKDRALAEVRAEMAQMELDGASRRGIISEMREKNRALEKAAARAKADVDMLAAELSRAHQLNSTIRAVASEAGDDDLPALGGGSAWWSVGAEWGLTQRVLVTKAVERHETTWRTAGCALAQLLLEPNLRGATEAAFATMTASIAAGLTRGDDDDGNDMGVLSLGGDGACEACAGTGVGNPTLASLRMSLGAAQARLDDFASGAGRRPVIIQLVSQSHIVSAGPRPGGDAANPPSGARSAGRRTPGIGLGDGDDDDERNSQWRTWQSPVRGRGGAGGDGAGGDLAAAAAAARAEADELQASVTALQERLAASRLAEDVANLRVRAGEESAQLSRAHAETVMAALDRWRTQGSVRFGRDGAVGAGAEGVLSPEELEKLSAVAAAGQYGEKHFKELDLCLDNAKLVNEITDARKDALTYRIQLARSNSRITELEAALEETASRAGSGAGFHGGSPLRTGGSVDDARGGADGGGGGGGAPGSSHGSPARSPQASPRVAQAGPGGVGGSGPAGGGAPSGLRGSPQGSPLHRGSSRRKGGLGADDGTAAAAGGGASPRRSGRLTGSPRNVLPSEGSSGSAPSLLLGDRDRSTDADATARSGGDSPRRPSLLRKGSSSRGAAAGGGGGGGGGDGEYETAGDLAPRPRSAGSARPRSASGGAGRPPSASGSRAGSRPGSAGRGSSGRGSAAGGGSPSPDLTSVLQSQLDELDIFRSTALDLMTRNMALEVGTACRGCCSFSVLCAVCRALLCASQCSAVQCSAVLCAVRILWWVLCLRTCAYVRRAACPDLLEAAPPPVSPTLCAVSPRCRRK